MIVLFIVAIGGAVALLYYWSQTVSGTRHEMKQLHTQLRDAEGRTQYLMAGMRSLWDQLLLLEHLDLPADRHRLALEMNLLLPYLWQPEPNSFYINELRLKGEPLVKAINDPVLNRLWQQGTLESVSKIPLTMIGQLHDPDYDPERGIVRQHDAWYPRLSLWGGDPAGHWDDTRTPR